MSSDIIYAESLKRHAEIVHGFTTKALGADYDRIAVAARVLVSQIYYAEQIHSEKVIVIDENSELAQLPAADAFVTNRADVLVGVRTADCLPILVYDPVKKVVAAIHAGYRGLLKGVIQNTLNVMQNKLGTSISDVRVVIGPSVCINHYEVGQELIDEFMTVYPHDTVYMKNPGTKPHLDVAATAVSVIQKCGVTDFHLEHLAACTYEDEKKFFSHRRSPGNGRQFAFIGRLCEV